MTLPVPRADESTGNTRTHRSQSVAFCRQLPLRAYVRTWSHGWFEQRVCVPDVVDRSLANQLPHLVVVVVVVVVGGGGGGGGGVV